MGLLSGWFSSSSSSSPPAGGSTAGQLAATQPAPATKGASSSSGPAAAKKNVWRSVFDPGSNPNIDRVGSAYYDTVPKGGDTTSTWEQILRAQDYQRRSFSDIDRNKDGYVDAHELKAALPPSVQAAADTAALIKEVKPATEGRLTRKEYNDALDKYFLA